MRLSLLALLLCLSSFGQTIIGTNGTTTTPPVNWNGIIPQRPSTNETVTLNPPIFSWVYNPGSPTNSGYDLTNYVFQFQCSYSNDFSAPIVDVNTPSDCYNFLAPFTTSPVYWRVGYLSTNGVTNAWQTNVFYIAQNSNVWDRSYLGNTNNWAFSHPRLWFNSTNITNFSTWMQTNNTTVWAAITNTADTGLAQGFWSDANWGTNAYLADEYDRAFYIFSVAFAAKTLYLDGKWTNALVRNYSNFVYYANRNARWNIDYSSGGAEGSFLACAVYGYDWLYDDLHSVTKSNALFFLRKETRVVLDNFFWRSPTDTSIGIYPSANGDTNGEYPGPYWVSAYSQAKFGQSHPIQLSQFASWACLPILNDDPDARMLFELRVNYLIGRHSPYGMEALNRGRHYGYRPTFSKGVPWETTLIHSMFPGMAFTNNPNNARLSDWWVRMVPPNWISDNDTWGDYNVSTIPGWWRRPDFNFLGAWSGDGQITTAANADTTSLGSYSSLNPYFEVWVPFYYLKTPTATTNLTLANYWPNEGFVAGSSIPTARIDAFTNGVGFSFAARPMGSEMSHTHQNDGELEIWAYGAKINCNQGGSGYAQRPTWMNNSLLINGTGQVQTAWGPRVPVYGKITAFTNGSDFTYFAGDITQCYPHELFPTDPTGGANNPAGYFIADGNYAMPYVSNVTRHVVFPRRKYFVVYDAFTTTQAATFQWCWKTRQAATLTTNGFSYVSKVYDSFVTMPWLSVTTYVVSAVATNLTTRTVQSNSTNTYINPFTGGDLSAYADADDNTPRLTNAIYLANSTPTTSWHHLNVIYPVNPGDAPPTITRITDNTIRVQQGSDDDVISFNETNASPASTFIVLTGASNQGGASGGRTTVTGRTTVGVLKQ